MKRAWIECSKTDLRHNLKIIQDRMQGGCEIMAAIKADGYGCGIIETAEVLDKMNIHAFCVACLKEGIQLRKSGFKKEILIMGYTPIEQIKEVYQYDLIQTVVDLNYAQLLDSFELKIKVHIKIDTGMHRLGERAENIENIKKIYECQNLQILGIYSHICANDLSKKKDAEYANNQIKLFDEVILQLVSSGIDVKKTHIQSSYSVFQFPQCHYDYARIGAAMYGVLAARKDAETIAPELRPILSLKSQVADLHILKKGEVAGYDLQYEAKKDSVLATCSIGYVDGVPRSLSCGKGKVLIRGTACPIVGRICMDQLMVDVSEIAESVQIADEAVLIGKQNENEISIYDVAEACGSIPVEIMGRLGSRLDRVFI